MQNYLQTLQVVFMQICCVFEATKLEFRWS